VKISKTAQVCVLSAVAVIVAIGALVWYSAYRGTRDLEVRASRAIVAWVFEDQSMPGFEDVRQVPGFGEHRFSGPGGGYVSSDVMREAKRWYVICDFLPQDIPLSDNPRIERISAEEAGAILDQAVLTGEGSFLWIFFSRDRSGRVSVSRNEIKLTAATTYAPLGGDMYEFTFTMVDGQLNVTGRHAGGS
jgi:hypothetical protein